MSTASPAAPAQDVLRYASAQGRWGLLATPEEIAHPPRSAPAEPRLAVEPAFAPQMEVSG